MMRLRRTAHLPPLHLKKALRHSDQWEKPQMLVSVTANALQKIK
jgi:hypothetical protein